MAQSTQTVASFLGFMLFWYILKGIHFHEVTRWLIVVRLIDKMVHSNMDSFMEFWVGDCSSSICKMRRATCAPLKPTTCRSGKYVRHIFDVGIVGTLLLLPKEPGFIPLFLP